ncbi:hypothetical protein DSM21852_37580 [Methylocystis bryophila]|uniref:NB-ARC domain-containing protein n=1 Tax=Methylocystis bryophila TaxID=655015 RepID=A0A1W6MSA0_9HYPH|nr:hypothetical protein B1812_04670 [Methylocystis bryophila]BDV40505.1 hypothetical protein DSM21852_37580 [Methylocystis bryophila]
MLQRDAHRVVAVVLRGPPGCGNSWLASAYAEHTRADYRLIWRLRADSEATLRADLLDLALETSGLARPASEEQLVESALDFINNAGADCLFIFDHADESELIERYWPQSGAARVLTITSLDSEPQRGERIEIQPWPSDASVDFLLACGGLLKERREAEALSDVLGGLPLAHALAAAYCAQTKIGFGEYRNRLEAGRADAGEKDDVVASAYALSIRAAKQFHPAAGRLMESAALLGAGSLPLAFFYESYLPLMPRTRRARASSPTLRSVATAFTALARRPKCRTEDVGARELTGWRPLSKDELNEAVAILESFGLVASDARSAGDAAAARRSAFEIHPRLRRIILAGADREAVEPLLDALQRLLAREAQSGDPLSKKARSLRTMATALLDASAATGGLQEEAISLHAELARSFRDAGSAVSVPIALFEKAITLAELRPGAESEKLSSLLAEIAALYADKGGDAENARAVALFAKALTVEQAGRGDGSALPLRLSDLALALRRLGGRENLERAVEFYGQALEIEEARHGAGAPIVAIRLANLAAAREEIGERDNLIQSRALLERALRIEEAALGEAHPYVALRLSSLAWTLKRLGGAENLGLAAACLVRALKIEEAANGSDHPHVAIRLSNLALVLKEIGGGDNLDLAAMCLERALVIDGRTIDEADPEHAKHLSNLAAILLQLGGDKNLRRAEHCQREALRLDIQNLGKDHPQAALNLLALCAILRARGV